MIKLDLFDRKILTELDKRSNLPLRELARKIKRSKQFVLYRMRRMEDGGLIKSYNAIVDLNRLGILTYRFYFKMRSFGTAEKSLFLKFLSKFEEEILVIAALHGKWDYGIILGVKSMQRLHEIFTAIMDKFVNNIQCYNFCVYLPIHNFSRSFLEGDDKIEERIFGKSEAFFTQRKEDKKILGLYATGTRQPLSRIAQKLNIGLGTVRSRIKTMEKEKVICGYKLGLDLTQIGFDNYRVDIYLKSTHRLAELHTYCKFKSNIYQVHYTIGGAGIELELFVKNLRELVGLIDELTSAFKDVIDFVDYFSYSTFLRMDYVPD